MERKQDLSETIFERSPLFFANVTLFIGLQFQLSKIFPSYNECEDSDSLLQHSFEDVPALKIITWSKCNKLACKVLLMICIIIYNNF